MSDLFEQVTTALDQLKLAQAAHAAGDNAAEDWISVSIPRLRVGASPLVLSALDAIERDPEHRKMFTEFVNDAISNPKFRESLKKSLKDPAVMLMVKALVDKNVL